ncbi:MAG: alpha/beta hydrolase [Pseudomonadota bacterium]
METKYLDILDEETLAFVKHTEDFYPPYAVNAPIPEQRQYYDALCREYHIEYPEGVSSSDRTLKNREAFIQLRNYVSVSGVSRAHIVFFHGGGFVVGNLETHDSICAEFCGRTGCSVTAVDYRLAPEHLHPAAFDDSLVAFQRIANETDLPIILVGDSAGGNLAAAVSHTARKEEKQPIGQVLIYPALGGDQTKGSYIEHANAPGLTLDDIDYYHRIRTGGKGLPQDVSAMPLLDEDFSNLPPTVIITAECDPLADDGRDYRDKIAAAGGKVVWINEEGLIHGYLRARSTVKRAADSVTRIVEAIEMLADGKWEYN